MIETTRSVTPATCSLIEACRGGSWWEVSATRVGEPKGTAWLQGRAAISAFVDVVTTVWPVQK